MESVYTRMESSNKEETVVPYPAMVFAISSCTRLAMSILVGALARRDVWSRDGFGTGVPFGMRRITQRSTRLRPTFWVQRSLLFSSTFFSIFLYVG